MVTVYTIYLLTINAIGFLVMLIDKYKAVKNLWRIPESTLIAIALVGGSFGMLLGMQTARHKTKHPKFVIGIPLIFALQAALALFIWSFFFI